MKVIQGGSSNQQAYYQSNGGIQRPISQQIIGRPKSKMNQIDQFRDGVNSSNF